MATPLRIAAADLIAAELGPPHNLPAPVVDLGGSGKHAWVSRLLGRADVRTWDLRAGPDVERVVDACRMADVPDGWVGTLLSIAVLEHVKRPWDAAREIARVVRPGGLIFVFTVFSHPYHPSEARDRDLAGAEPPLLDYWRFSVDGLRELFRKPGCRELGAGYVETPKAEGTWWHGAREADR